MYPYGRHVGVAGRVGALIEVRAGIHRELTGRENIYLYGLAAGARRGARSRRRFDEIVAFAELEEAIDRQVKFYSTRHADAARLRASPRSSSPTSCSSTRCSPSATRRSSSAASSGCATCSARARRSSSSPTTSPRSRRPASAGMWLQDGVVEREGQVREVLGGYRQWIEEGADPDCVGRRSRPCGQVRGQWPRLRRSSNEPVLGIRLVVDADEPHFASLFFGVSEGPPPRSSCSAGTCHWSRARRRSVARSSIFRCREDASSFGQPSTASTARRFSLGTRHAPSTSPDRHSTQRLER